MDERRGRWKMGRWKKGERKKKKGGERKGGMKGGRRGRNMIKMEGKIRGKETTLT